MLGESIYLFSFAGRHKVGRGRALRYGRELRLGRELGLGRQREFR